MKLSYKIKFPEELKPVYDFLQSEFTRIIQDPVMREKVLSVDISLFKQNYWTEMRLAIGEETQYKWKKDKSIPYPSWYFCAFAEQLRQFVKSRQKQIKLYNALSLFDFNLSDKFYNYCIENNIYFSNTFISNLTRARSIKDLPYNKTFVLDFSFVNTPVSVLNRETNEFTFQYMVKENAKDDNTCTVQILTHPSTKYTPGNKLSKPIYSKTKDGEYYGYIPYEVEDYQILGENILAIDIGKVRYYTARVIKSNRDYLDPILNSKHLEYLSKKIDTLYNQKETLIEKQKRVNDLFLYSSYIDSSPVNKWVKRNKEISFINNKISLIKEEMTKIMANEIVEICYENECNSVFVEELNWLESRGGKWNHSAIFNQLNHTLQFYGIKLYKVSARNSSKEHPITGEIGKEDGRNIVFKDKTKIDRDELATLNLGQRDGKRKETIPKSGRRKNVYKSGYKIKSLRDKTCPTPKRAKRKVSLRKETYAMVNEIIAGKQNRNMEMVIFLPGTSENKNTTWSKSPRKVGFSRETTLLYRLQCLAKE